MIHRVKAEECTVYHLLQEGFNEFVYEHPFKLPIGTKICVYVVAEHGGRIMFGTINNGRFYGKQIEVLQWYPDQKKVIYSRKQLK